MKVLSRLEARLSAAPPLSVTASVMVESAKDLSISGFRWTRSEGVDVIDGQQEWNHFYERA